MLDLEIHNKKVMTSGHFKANHKKGGYKIVLGIYFQQNYDCNCQQTIYFRVTTFLTVVLFNNDKISKLNIKWS